MSSRSSVVESNPSHNGPPVVSNCAVGTGHCASGTNRVLRCLL